MIPELLRQQTLAEEWRRTGLYLKLAQDRTLELWQDPPNKEQGVRGLPQLRAVFPPGTPNQVIQEKAQQWAKGVKDDGRIY